VEGRLPDQPARSGIPDFGRHGRPSEHAPGPVGGHGQGWRGELGGWAEIWNARLPPLLRKLVHQSEVGRGSGIDAQGRVDLAGAFLDQDDDGHLFSVDRVELAGAESALLRAGR
jgi:hypothetical protein